MREYRTPGGHNTAAGHLQEHLPQPENIHRAHCELRSSYKSAQDKATPSGMTASTCLTPTCLGHIHKQTSPSRCHFLYQYSGSKYLYIRKRPITGRHRNPMDTTLDCSSTDPRFEPASSQDFFISILASPSIIVIFFYVFHISVLGNNTL